MSTPTRAWTDIAPADATEIDLAKDLTITAPLNENGERCPWPWEPQQLVGAPMGQYRCGYCGAMCVAGIPHLDYAPEERTLTADNFDEVAEWCGGRPALSDRRVLIIDQMGETGEARHGDTIHRDGFGEFTIIPGPRVFHRADGWTIGSDPDAQACTINHVPEGHGQRACTATAIWKVVERHDSGLTIGFYCDTDLPAEHRAKAGVAA